MRIQFAVVASLLLLGCSTQYSRVSDREQSRAIGQADGADENAFPEGLDYPDKPSDEQPKIGADFRAQENGAAEAKVVGGTKVSPGQFLDTVGVGSTTPGDVRCTGVLVEPDIVLSAAHCAQKGYSARVYVGSDRNSWQAVYTVARVEHGLMKRNVDPSCSPVGLKCGMDIAVLLLEKPVEGVIPRKIAPASVVDQATSYRVAGFGRVDGDATVRSRYKLEASVTAVSNNCAGTVRVLRRAHRPDEAVYGCQPGQEIVAGQMRGDTDSCKGDSGGPLYVGPQGSGEALSNADYLLAGLTSRATSQSVRLCGDGGVYERLNSKALTWINAATARLRANE